MAKKILRINMSDLSAKYEPLPEKWVKWGGRGLTSAITFDEVPPDCHPLGPNNKLTIAPGWVSGSPAAPSSGRTSFGGKSPLTGGIKETNAGGLASQKIAKLQIAAIIIEGTPAPGKWYLISINKDEVKFEDASDIFGKGMYEVDEILWERYPVKPAVIGIGQAGEMKLSNAGISVNDQENRPGRYAGRGGMGAVMGTKGIKAIVIDDTGAPGVEIANKELFAEGRKKLTAAILEHDLTKKGGGLPSYGTAILVNIINEAGGLPTRNFSTGQFEGAAKISGEMIAETIEKRCADGGEGQTGHACHPGCVIKCSNIYPNEDGSHLVSCVEYETAWALGANCGIDDLDYVAMMTYECNDIGLDTIEAGNTVAIAMEGGLLEFGDQEGALKTFDEIRNKTPLGRILGQGVEATAKAFGVHRVPTVKHQSMPAYEPRAIKGIGVTYATTPMGADHTAGYTIAPEIAGVGGKVDPLSDEGKADLSLTFQAATAFIDSTGYCLFIAFPILDIATGWAGMAESVAGVTGLEITGDDVIPIGKEILKMERLFNEGAGFTAEDDRIPEFMNYEPLAPHNVVWGIPDEELDKVYEWVHNDG
ncbi:MAG: aldehyde ferredoxin oxidoreductase family protein [Anaerolineales bacterium]|jgi:aldehyde:ferredoxin oxidoreductase